MLKSMKSRVALGVLVVSSAIASNVSAALTVDQQAVVTGIETLYADISTFAWGLVLTATLLFTGIKLFKRGVSKAT